MGTIFVAYGGPGNKNAVLEFAVEQAAASEHDLLVYHVLEDEQESSQEIREEVERVVESVDPSVTYEVQFNTRSEVSDRTNISKQKRLTSAIQESDRDYEYVVMGCVERPTIEGIVHASMTEAVLEMHSTPVMLVPV
ncbi:universal stress protein [Halanaeroarchaeum sulfurireducens]|uniref:UspA domain-containing protein n=1 Tax=Halanaeroarchaeum sulfurireducens TaxID=1604004 RepID=A0A0F7PBM0_9EURY|nr:universal stress protein [Halanaeroarchaeum sulfurireducens]AKH97555.1 hypothetical protein HLASF_1066 [Halanaeroarchaeum sulfurireducens]ALG81951.1 hypothetical protein HLASA_1055 [Halanaeroarchaeum sulfurireducens]